VDPVIGPVYGDERLADIAQGGFAVGSQLRFGQHDPGGRPPAILHLADRMDAERILVKPPLRLLGHLDFGDQPARRRIPPGEFDAGCLANQAAATIAPDEILRPERLTVGERDVDAGVVLRKPRHFPSAIDRHPQLADPLGQDALDMVLPQLEEVVVPGGEVADVQGDHVEARDLISHQVWPRPPTLRRDPGLAASPPVRPILGVERRGGLSFRLSAVDGQALCEAAARRARRHRGPGKMSRRATDTAAGRGVLHPLQRSRLEHRRARRHSPGGALRVP
jgi:hypothetical protein